jgi:hypothetical protein
VGGVSRSGAGFGRVGELRPADDDEMRYAVMTKVSTLFRPSAEMLVGTYDLRGHCLVQTRRKIQTPFAGS